MEMFLTLCYDEDIKITYKVLKSLEEKGFTLLNNNVLDIDVNRQIDIQGYYQLRKKSPNNPYVYLLHSKMIQSKLEEIEQSDVVLFYNPKDGEMSQLMFFYLTLSWHLLKKTYLWKPLNKRSPFYNEVFPLDIPSINEDIDKIVPPVKSGLYKQEEVKEIIIEAPTKKEEIKKKKLIKKELKIK